MAVHAKQALRMDAGGMDLRATLFSGQSFSWREDGANLYTGVAGTRAVQAWQQGPALFVRRLDGQPPGPQDEAFWRRYFALDTDYTALHRAFCTHPQLAECVALAPGLRLLRQPYFDTLLGFIMSQRTSIVRTTGAMARLRQAFGPALPGGEHGFPAPGTLAALSPEDLAPVGAGYRDKYLIDAARRVAAGEVSEAALAPLADDEARALLMRIYGVGRKVADCVLLYALGRTRVVPVDVWIERAARIFPGGMPGAARGSEGIAQLYVFVWARENLPRGG